MKDFYNKLNLSTEARAILAEVQDKLEPYVIRACEYEREYKEGICSLETLSTAVGAAEAAYFRKILILPAGREAQIAEATRLKLERLQRAIDDSLPEKPIFSDDLWEEVQDMLEEYYILHRYDY